MSDFAILTDSSADLGADLAEELEIQVLPLSFILQGKTYYNYPDNREMSPQDFYLRLVNGQTATTNAVNVAQYTEAIEPLLQAGKDVLILAFSSGLSATYSASAIAVRELRELYPERKLYTVDTLCASLGQGLLVCLAARERQKGRSIEEVRDWAEANKMAVNHFFTVDDLLFLKRGGRISATTAVVGSMLHIKPILQVDGAGKLVTIDKVRGRKAAITALADRMAQTAAPDPSPVFISHGNCLEDAELLAQTVRERFGTREVYINYVGPVIGAHTGPGVLTLFYMGQPRSAPAP